MIKGAGRLVGVLAAAPLAVLLRAIVASLSQSAIVQPAERRRRVSGTRSRLARSGCQGRRPGSTGAVVVRNGIIVGEGRTTSFWRATRLHMPSCWPYVMQRADSRTVTCPIAKSSRPRRLVRCARAHFIRPASAAITTRARRTKAWLRNSHANGGAKSAISSRLRPSVIRSAVRSASVTSVRASQRDLPELQCSDRPPCR